VASTATVAKRYRRSRTLIGSLQGGISGRREGPAG